MAYTVLARRYRSGTFDELIGQGHVAQTLKNAITTGRIAHAFLFTGTRGTGKTSSARILAKCLNCESSDKPTVTPCGKCYSCQAIARGDDIDVIEIDAASNTGVDNVREIIENAQFRPARSRFKVYIIDEVHMLSKSAFNALLKTLEEPPEHVKFILATTEAEKVLPTILSRCQRYDFRNIPTREIAAHLKNVCKQEKIEADDDAILLVAKAGAGSMRDALSLLDRLLSAVGQHLTVGSIEQLLGLPRSGQIFDLVTAIGAGDVKAVLLQVDKLITSGLSPETLAGSLVDHLRNLLILKTVGKDNELVETPGLSLDDLMNQAQRFDAVALSQDIVVLEELRRQLRSSAAGRALIDATMVRLALAEQFTAIGDMLDGVTDGSVPVGIAEKKKFESDVAPYAPLRVNIELSSRDSDDSRAHPARELGVREESSASNTATVEETTASTPSEEEDAALPAVGKVWEGSGPTSIFAAFKKAPPKPVAPPPSEAPARSDSVGPVDRKNFDDLLNRLRSAAAAEQPTVVGFLDGAKIIEDDGSTFTIEWPKNYEMSAKMLDRNGKRESLQTVLGRLVGEPAGIRLTVSDRIEEPPPRPTPAAANWKPKTAPAAAPEPVAPQNPGIIVTDELRAELAASDPLIKALGDVLGGRVVKIEES